MREGVVVVEVAPGSPRAQAGIRPQDIVTAIDGTEVRRGGDLRRILRASRHGARVTLRVVRPDGTADLGGVLGSAPAG